MSKNVYPIDSREARLADIRIQLIRDDSIAAPWISCETIYVPTEMIDDENTVIDKRKITVDYGDFEFATTYELIEKFTGIKKDKVNADILAKIWNGEKNGFENYLNDDTWTIIIEKWNAAERQFDIIDHLYGCYSKDDVSGGIIDLLDENKINENDVVICCDKLDAFKETKGNTDNFIICT